MGDCNEMLEQHFESVGHQYYVVLVIGQLFYFLFYNMAAFIEGSFDVNRYQYYKCASLMLLLSAMIYFLI
jgi:hypothetical protein